MINIYLCELKTRKGVDVFYRMIWKSYASQMKKSHSGSSFQANRREGLKAVCCKYLKLWVKIKYFVTNYYYICDKIKIKNRYKV